MFLRGLLFHIDSSSEVLIRDDLLQGRRYQRIKHLKIREQTLLPLRGIHGVFFEFFPSQDDSSQRRRNLRIKHLKNQGSNDSSVDCDAIRSPTDLATSSSLIHNIAITEQPEQEHTSVLTFQHWKSAESGKSPKCSSEVRFSRIFHQRFLRTNSSSTVLRSSKSQSPGKARS